MQKTLFALTIIALFPSLLFGMERTPSANDVENNLPKQDHALYKKIKIPKSPVSIRIKFAKNLYQDVCGFDAGNYLKCLPNELLKEVAEFAAYNVYDEQKKRAESIENAKVKASRRELEERMAALRACIKD